MSQTTKEAKSSTVTVRPTGPKAGAEVSGVDLRDELSPQTVSEIRAALMDHGVIWFRNQTITPEEQVEFARNFGDLYVHPAWQADQDAGDKRKGAIGRAPEIFPIYADENSKHAPGEEWHADTTADAKPPFGSILQLQELPALGGDTMFCSMSAAFAALSDSMKDMLRGLTAVHDSGPAFRGLTYDMDDYVHSVHPVVCRHPESGDEVLFVNSVYTSHIVELSSKESAALLQMLFEHVNTPEFHVRFHWAPGSVLFWDNRAVQHRAVFDYFPQRRVGTRVQVVGSEPVAARA